VRSHDAGFTMVEVLIGLLIISVTFGSIYALSEQNMRIMRSARSESRASEVVHYEMDRLRTIPWADIEAYGAGYTLSESNNPTMAHLNSASGFARFESFPSSSVGSPTKTVTVVATWTGSDGLTKTNLTMSLITKHGFLR
jgi:prepilin-type N-terminal cleavage/methylation domain-containing protein